MLKTPSFISKCDYHESKYWQYTLDYTQVVEIIIKNWRTKVLLIPNVNLLNY